MTVRRRVGLARLGRVTRRLVRVDQVREPAPTVTEQRPLKAAELKGAHKMNMPGFSADASLSRFNGLHPMAIWSWDSKSQVYPARLKNEDEGVDCDSCIGAQCVELHCLEKS